MKLLTLENFRHGIGSVGDLPIPFETVLNVSALVIILTFVFLKVSWKESVLVAEETVLESNPSILGKLFGLIILLLIVFFLRSPQALQPCPLINLALNLI